MKRYPCILCGDPGHLSAMFPAEEIWNTEGGLCWFYVCENHERSPETDAQITRELIKVQETLEAM